MHYEFACAAAVENPGEIGSLAGAGCVLQAFDDFGRGLSREFSYGLSSYDEFAAELMAVRLALMSVKPAYRGFSAAIYTSAQKVIDVVDFPDDGDYSKLVDELRTWVSYYRAAVLRLAEKSSPMYSRALGLAREAAKSQKNTDSGTKEEIVL